MKNKKTFKEVFGKNPWDPWSAKAGIAETTSAQLQKYLLTRGINPRYVTKDQKIAHSKSNQFKQWAATHKEEVEQIDEISKDTVKSYAKKARFDLRAGHATIGSFTRTPAEKDRASKMLRKRNRGMFKAMKRLDPHNEEVQHIEDDMSKNQEQGHIRDDIKMESVLTDDPQGTLTRVSERKKELSRSARIIKSLYKKKGVMKEDMHDHEKQDKEPAKVYGKAPKMEKADEKDNKGEEKPQAAATLSGGTTLTKQPRDVVELDPMMRNRPGQPDITKKDDKKKDDDKKEKKQDK